MSSCRCGCGRDATAGDFIPGHDQRLRARLEQEIGGLLVLEQLVDAATRYASADLAELELGREVRRLLKPKGDNYGAITT
jgi:hypothetical protein